MIWLTLELLVAQYNKIFPATGTGHPFASRYKFRVYKFMLMQ